METIFKNFYLFVLGMFIIFLTGIFIGISSGKNSMKEQVIKSCVGERRILLDEGILRLSFDCSLKETGL